MEERLKLLIDYLKREGIIKNQAEFAQRIGISKSNLSNALASRQRLGGNCLLAIQREFANVNLEWLTNGDGKMIKEATPVPDNILFAPLVSKYARAGFLAGYGDNEFLDSMPKIPFIIDEEQEHKGNYIAFEVKGDSLFDGTYRSVIDGDIVLCREISHELYKYNKLHLLRWHIFVIMTEEGILIKEITEHNVEEGYIIAHSYNEVYHDLKINVDDIKLLYNVVQIQRRK